MAGPELTQDLSDNPRVEVYFDPADLDPDTHQIRMYRFSENRTWLVRGGVDVTPGSAALDYEVPFYTTATYRAEMFAIDGTSIGFTDTSSTTVEVDDVWVHNPLVPTRAVLLSSIALLRGTAAKNVRPQPHDNVYVEGARVARRIGTSRRGVEDMPFGLAVESVADMDALQWMLGDYVTQQVGVLCIRTPPPVRIPRTFFASVDEPDEKSINVQWGGGRSNFLFTATEAEPPFPGITTPALSYSDMSEAFATYTALSAAIATYTESARSYQYAGLAG